MEYHGQAAWADIMQATLHYGSPYPNNTMRGSGSVWPLSGTDLAADFHNYTLEWRRNVTSDRPLHMRWLLDGVVFFQQV
jgi:hypothetical protein